MDDRSASPGPSAGPLTIAFFGLGAVSSSMLICLSELAERDDVPLRFVVVVLNVELARDALFHAERLFDRIDFIGLPDFAFSQFAFEAAYRERGRSALINLGISPGVTNFLIGLRLHQLPDSRRRDLKIESVDYTENVCNDRQVTIETMGLSYLLYRGLLGSSYAGATYISYPTAVGAAILAWHALTFLREEEGDLAGVVTGEDLARLLPRSCADAIRRDLVAWDIDLFETVRDATSV